MTRKDYILIAKAITDTQARIRASCEADHRERRDGGQENQLRGVRRVAAHICDALAADNPRFDPVTFLKACGYGAMPDSMYRREIGKERPAGLVEPVTRCPKCGCTVFQSSDSTSEYCSAHARPAENSAEAAESNARRCAEGEGNYGAPAD